MFFCRCDRKRETLEWLPSHFISLGGSTALLKQYDERRYAVRIRLRFVLKRRLHQSSIKRPTGLHCSLSMSVSDFREMEARLDDLRSYLYANPEAAAGYAEASFSGD